MASLFEIPIEKISGIGTKRGQLYRKLGIDTVGALVRFYPRSYEDWSNPLGIADARVGDVCCVKAIISTPPTEHRVAGGKLLIGIRVTDGISFMRIVFFNNRYVKARLVLGEEFVFYGKVTEKNSIKEMINPTFESFGKSESVHPVYSQTAGLTTRQIETAVHKALDMLPEVIKDPIPNDIREQYNLISLKDALMLIHFPKNISEINAARIRLIFEELLVLVLGLHSIKTKPTHNSGLHISKDYTDEFKRLLPFELTNAQSKAIADCVSDIVNSERSMNRLVQGDVGSGKTMVAAAACYTAIKNGYQAAVMVPTEILAQQHYETLAELFSRTDLRIALLTGSMNAKAKKNVLNGLSYGTVDLVIGTHSLISEKVEFLKLALVVTDEQHRFGVRQRADLLAKGDNPHLLVMSATPIPRTLALMIYGDLDISIINELPPGRQSVDTFLIDDAKRVRAYNFLIRHIEEGRQCYIVCPAVDDNEFGLIGAQSYAEDIQTKYFRNYRVEVIHGKMKPSRKDEIMQAFLNGDIDVLVSTTVIEVGVNVPNAVIMMVENAERFGISQLHQLRGRVGRGKYKSYCILVSNSDGEDAQRRLNALCSTNDGFAIADEDLKLRGPGDFFGSRQHGLPELKIADLAENMDVLRDAQQTAQDILKKCSDLSDPSLRGLRAEVKMLFGRVGEQLN